MTLSAIRRYGLTPAIGLSALLASTVMAVTSGPTATGVLGRAPTAENLEFEPTAVYGVESRDVKLKYRFNDPDGDDELGSVFSWATTDGAGNAIALGQTSSIPVVPEAAINQPLTACVTPKTSDIITDPSQGNQECATTTVLPPPPLVKNVDVKVKEADGLFVDTNNLTATYTWEGVGNDTSIYAYGPQGQSAALLQNGSGANTSAGTVPDFSLAGYAGRRVELSIQPQSHYGGIGSIVTTPVNAYIYNPNLPPKLASYDRYPQPTSAPLTIGAIRYQLDRNGGADGDMSEYEFYVNGVLVRSGRTNPGEIPEQSIKGYHGTGIYYLLPINGLGVKGARTTVIDVSVADPDALIMQATNVTVNAPSPLLVGSVVTPSYTLPVGTSNCSYDVLRVKVNDSEAEKRSVIGKYGLQASSRGITIDARWAGQQLEYLLLPVDCRSGKGGDVVSYTLPEAVQGVPAAVTNPAALPIIRKVESWGMLMDWTSARATLIIDADANGGFPISHVEAKFTGEHYLTGVKKTVTSYSLGDSVQAPWSLLSHYISVTIRAFNINGVAGPEFNVSLADLGAGPGGTGFFIPTGQLAGQPSAFNVSFVLDDNGVPGEGLRVGKKIRATYTAVAESYPGLMFTGDYSWNGGAKKRISLPGQIPEYVIQEKDIGKTIELKFDSIYTDNGDYTISAKSFTTTTNGFSSVIVLE